MTQTTDQRGEVVLSARGIVVSFNGVRVVKNVDLDLRAGEVVALLGENGAGKSSLMKVLAGVYSADSSQIELAGQRVEIGSVTHARRHGVAMVHQELNLVGNLSISENIALGREPHGPLGVVDRRASIRQASEALAEVGSSADPRTLVRRLSIADQQLVEIAKALAQRDVTVLLMDEPTSSLPEEQAQALLALIRRLRESGYAIVITTHRIAEAFAVADRIVVMRDGAKVSEFDAHSSDVTRDSVVHAMIGRELTSLFPDKRENPGQVVLEVSGLCGGMVSDVSMTVRAGEILGLGGLVGAGRTEVARLIFGCDPHESGTIRVDGIDRTIRGPRDAVEAGLSFVPEDRKQDGLVLGFDLEKNLSLPNLPQWSRGGVVSVRGLAARARGAIDSFGVRARSYRQPAGTLSGGNQQKIVLAKWMVAPRRVLILDEPTRGVDVGARSEIYRLIDEAARSGVAVLLISSDMEELIGMSDRVVVMAMGQVQGVLQPEQISARRIFELASRMELSA